MGKKERKKAERESSFCKIQKDNIYLFIKYRGKKEAGKEEPNKNIVIKIVLADHE